MVRHFTTGSPSGHLLRRALSPLLVAVAVVIVLLEATVWRWLTALGRVLGRFAVFTALERLVARLSPGAVVAVFVLPFIPIVPLLKFGELWLIRHHHFVWAAIVIIGAKVVGAAFSTRVFAIARPKMLQVRWFARCDATVAQLLDLGHQALERLPGWRAAREYGHRLHLRARGAVLAAWRRLRQRTTRAGAGGLGRRLAAALRRERREGASW
ncbi:conserved membrane protein of unknown function [Rhodovastum atsumiense]|uniref:Uncharacterized protein n=1 Tax=Rhodovastum atsumiense TaxID=504468 RepID=A0A5M6IYW6_9PROT|nr:hypothetical protein [Rhodovastum atsumiense]KAA5612575.1 hypothetical protein F1189_08960 [Rhodovastum atsumiense]CAH2601334.1 conserved membrane protein of unknown function [Rhodovastum atsumiense]